jgi:hypothetical protein
MDIRDLVAEDDLFDPLDEEEDLFDDDVPEDDGDEEPEEPLIGEPMEEKPAMPVADVRPPRQRIEELLSEMPGQRRVLLKLIDYCREPKTGAEMDKRAEELARYNFTVFSPVVMRELLERAGAIVYIKPETDEGAEGAEPAEAEAVEPGASDAATADVAGNDGTAVSDAADGAAQAEAAAESAAADAAGDEAAAATADEGGAEAVTVAASDTTGGTSAVASAGAVAGASVAAAGGDGLEGELLEHQPSFSPDHALVSDDGLAFDEDKVKHEELVNGDENIQIDYLEVEQVDPGLWQATPEGLEIVDEQDDFAKVKILLGKEPQYEDIYRKIMDFCTEEGGRSAKEIDNLVNDEPILESPRRYSGYFVGRLEREGAIEWRDGWVLTDTGSKILEEMVAKAAEAAITA